MRNQRSRRFDGLKMGERSGYTHEGGTGTEYEEVAGKQLPNRVGEKRNRPDEKECSITRTVRRSFKGGPHQGMRTSYMYTCSPGPLDGQAHE